MWSLNLVARKFLSFSSEKFTKKCREIFNFPRHDSETWVCWLKFLTDFERNEADSDLLQFFGFSRLPLVYQVFEENLWL